MIEDSIRELIIEKYGSMRQFSIEIDVPNTTIDSILKRGVYNSNVDNVIKICKGLDISVDKLIDENIVIKNGEIQTEENSVAMIPVFGTIKAGIPIESQNDIIEYVDIPRKWTIGDKKFFALKISGDSMIPKYQPNDIVIFEQNDDIEAIKNKDVAVMVNGTESTFKKILVNDQGIVLVPYNNNYEMMMFSKEQVQKMPIKVVGIAREKRTKIE